MNTLDQIMRKMREYQVAEHGERPQTWVISQEQWIRLRDELRIPGCPLPESPTGEVKLAGATLIILPPLTP
jgi:hypothetical protein